MSLKIPRDCVSFVPLEDGTLCKEWGYCNLSFQCKQTGMKSKYVKMITKDGEEVYDFLCTGMKIENKEENTELIKAV